MNIKMKELPISERPYEKLETYGAQNLTNSELLAIIIKTGTKDDTAIGLAQKVLKLNDGTNKEDLSFLQDISIVDLKKIKGIGRVKAVQLLAVCELAKRINKPINKQNIKINNSNDISPSHDDNINNHNTNINTPTNPSIDDFERKKTVKKLYL
jgi:DNA repair protein RadC